MAFGLDGEALDWRVRITIDKDMIDSNLTDKDVYFDTSRMGSDFWDNVKSDGGDIRVSLSDGSTRMAVELKNFDTGTETGQVYLKLSSISSTIDEDYFIFWGNAGLSQPAASATYGSQNVWDSSFMLVWHHEELPNATPPQMLDSTSNGNNGTTAGSMSAGDRVVGIPGFATDYDGDDDVITVPTSAEFEFATGDSFTLESLHFTDPDVMNTAGGFTQALISYDNHPAGSPRDRYLLFYTSAKKLKFQLGTLGGTDASAEAPSAETGSVLRHAAGVLDDDTGTVYIYKNGVELANTADGSAAWDSANDPVSLHITGRNDVAKSINYLGNVSETRVSNVARSAAWLRATYENLAIEATFNKTIGTPEQSTGANNYAHTGGSVAVS